MPATSLEQDHAPAEILELTRTFDAPPELVWRLWRDPEHMVRWHGPEGMWLTHCELDFRVGGKWRRCMSRGEGHQHWIHGEYLEIDAPRRLVFTYINEYDPFETIVSLDFEARDGRTLMHFRQSPFPTLEERDGHGWGWTSSFNLFAGYLYEMKAADGEVVGQPRADGVAEDLLAARQNQQKPKENAHADSAATRRKG